MVNGQIVHTDISRLCALSIVYSVHNRDMAICYFALYLRIYRIKSTVVYTIPAIDWGRKRAGGVSSPPSVAHVPLPPVRAGPRGHPPRDVAVPLAPRRGLDHERGSASISRFECIYAQVHACERLCIIDASLHCVKYTVQGCATCSKVLFGLYLRTYIFTSPFACTFRRDPDEPTGFGAAFCWRQPTETCARTPSAS